jgi:Raf kinase inhibitor-like YbhB/YbcL family protein
LGTNTRHAAIGALLISVASNAIAAGSLRISSPSFQQNETMPPEFTCDGEGTSPALRFSGAPAAAKSLVLIVVDPDVPRVIKADGRYLHWALWDLSPGRTEIVQGQRARGLNENGAGGYIPACPPNGEHRYLFQLFAIDSVLGDARFSGEADLRRAMEGHVLDQAELVGRYTTRSFRTMRMIVGSVVLLIVLALIYRIVARRRRSLPPTSNL